MTTLSAPPTFSQARVARADGVARLDSTRSSRASIFRDAQEIIRRESGDNLTVDVLARRVLVSRRQLQRVFTEAGTTVRAEVGAARMERAAELLHETSLPIREVARRLGYRQAAQFSKAFRQRYGLTPSQWREGAGESP